MRSLILPDLVQYTKPQQRQAAQEMRDHCDKVQQICVMMGDYMIMRNQVRTATP